jgi:hypothetical protein
MKMTMKTIGLIVFLVLGVAGLVSADQLFWARGGPKQLKIGEGIFRAVGRWKPMTTLTSMICFRVSETAGNCSMTDLDGDIILMNDYEVTSWNARGLRARLISPVSTEILDVDFETKSVTRTIVPTGKESFVMTLGE